MYEGVPDDMLKEVIGEEPPENVRRKPIYLEAIGDTSPMIYVLDAILGVEYSKGMLNPHFCNQILGDSNRLS